MNPTQPMSKGGRALPAVTPQNQPGEGKSFPGKLMRSILSSTERAANVRRFIVWAIFWIIFILRMWNGDPAGWVAHTQAIFVSLFSGNLIGFILAIFNWLFFAIARLFSPDVLRPVLILLAPFLLTWQIVAVYLQDIFELEHAHVARRYLMQAALADEYEKINVRSGSIDLRSIDSPLVQIGGPGYIQVELDSVALFEKADGTCRVIGPTVEGKNYRFIAGFERLRDVIDLRDISTDSLTNVCRSRDGIPVIAKDVRLVYSVQRGKQIPTLEKPYPFVEEAVRQLVFQQTSVVTAGQPRIVSRDDYWKQTYKRWSGAMPGLILSSLSDFTSEHNLSEFLANIGKVELEALARLEMEIRQASATMAPAEEADTGSPGQTDSPDFTPRSKITNLFYDFTSGFPRRAENKGVQLEWIGVGTWGTPASAELINKNHLEAWRISRENYLRGHADALEHLREDAQLQELQNLIHKTLLANFKDARDAGLPPNQVAQKLLIAYREQLLAAWELFERDRKIDPQPAETTQKVSEALRILNGFLAHQVN